MKTGKLQRRWQENAPVVYDKESRIVCLDIKPEKKVMQVDGEDVEVDGFSFLQVEIDGHIDYGHVKSQLIEAGFAQKDEFGLLMNAVDGILNAIDGASSWAKFKDELDVEDIAAFSDFMAFRKMCADAAKVVMQAY